MFKKCRYCNAYFKGEGHFCSDMCEIKNHAPEVIRLVKETISSLEIKKELSEIPVMTRKIIENKGNLIQAEADLTIKSKILGVTTS